MPKILAIDDKEDNLITLSALLKVMIPDCTVNTALSGPEGLEKAIEDPPDTILLDIKMPGMDGYEVCRRFKENTITRHIPVIMISAVKTDSGDLVKGLETGADAYLAKPIDEYVLAAQVKTALRVKEAEDRLRKQNEWLEILVQERSKTLSASETRFRELFNHMSSGVAVYEPVNDGNDFIFRDLNKSGERMDRINRSDVLGRPLLEVFPGAGEFGLLRVLKRVYETGRPENMPVSLYTDGRLEGWRENYVYKLPSGEVVAVYDDVTERKQAKEASERLEVQLRQAQKMEAISTLAGGIAHDFNNILSAILGYTQLAQMKLEDESEVFDDLHEVLQAAERAKKLIKQILVMARSQEQEKQPIELRLIVKEALKLLRASIPSFIEIRREFEAETGVINGDPTQIHQVLMNLCTNAAHAMAEQGGILEVTLRTRAIDAGQNEMHLSPGEYLKLTVRDTGHGMTPDVMEKIFDPYFTTKGPGEGTGIGLSVVYGIVSQHNGAITAESDPGKGTAFHVYLPVMRQQKQAVDQALETPLPTGTERILYIDDEPSLAQMGEKMLARLGYDAVSMTSSTNALAMIKEDPHRFDLVITDTTMPQMPGDILARELMKIRPDMPVIICTGYSSRMSMEKAKTMGIRGFLMKPLDFRELAETIRAVLENRGPVPQPHRKITGR